ncbi:hypothetical protein N7517_008130 [Penicillium concentricum]|uniref:Uncharacterized protein n=1 Tax=Penicillium concentricum TaxID=293559 RepID=A0A9W9V2F3_9EURO|nr:uncharacterized protein N7517_008130 [Penicillium concentricum]KAJ5365244.1 hypothetical protein N7517_008130 [Penicillium concentricum]
MRRLYIDQKKPDRLAEHLKLLDGMEEYQQPAGDRFYAANYPHTNGQNCDQCDTHSVVDRPARRNHRMLHFHYGNIASGNYVPKDVIIQDEYSNDPKLNVL